MRNFEYYILLNQSIWDFLDLKFKYTFTLLLRKKNGKWSEYQKIINRQGIYHLNVAVLDVNDDNDWDRVRRQTYAVFEVWDYLIRWS